MFDSGYGGLTILKELRLRLPDYDYMYLGDNARAPYGTRTFDEVYRYTLEAVKALFESGCHLVILACNTASAKALRTIQQRDLPRLDASRRVLGVIRPTAEYLGRVTSTGHIGVLGTPGTVASGSYDIEIAKLYPDYKVSSRACPMWVPLVEYREADTPGADYFVGRDIDALLSLDPAIDTIVLGCTHYPLLIAAVERAVAGRAQVLSQGRLVADSLALYLRRHPDMEHRITRGGSVTFLTTGSTDAFDSMAALFLNHPVSARQVVLGSNADAACHIINYKQPRPKPIYK